MKRHTLYKIMPVMCLVLLCCCSDKKDAGQVAGHEPEAVAASASRTDNADSVKQAGLDADRVSAGNDPDTAVTETPAADVVDKKVPLKPVYMSMWGKAGETDFLFDMEGTTGSYIPYDMAKGKEYGQRRQLKLVSYDPASGVCVINAYMDKKYIGQFVGTFAEEELEVDEDETHYVQAYSGIFTSAKGARIDFSFYFD